MLIMSSLCPLLLFFTKRNNREKKNVKRKNFILEEIYIAISQLVEWL